MNVFKAKFYQEVPAEGFRSLLEVQAAVERLVKTVKPRKVVIEFVGEQIRLVEADTHRVLHLISLETVEPIICEKSLWVLSAVSQVGAEVCYVLSTKVKAAEVEQALKRMVTAYLEALPDTSEWGSSTAADTSVSAAAPGPVNRLASFRQQSLRAALHSANATDSRSKTQPTAASSLKLKSRPASTHAPPNGTDSAAPNPCTPGSSVNTNTSAQGPTLLALPGQNSSLSKSLMSLPTQSREGSLTRRSDGDKPNSGSARSSTMPAPNTASWRRKFDAVLLGTELVEDANVDGFAAALAAWHEKEKTSKKRTLSKGEPVFLVVSSTSVAVEERGSTDKLNEAFIKHVVFTAAQPAYFGPKLDALGYMIKDPRLECITCVLFQVDKGVGADVAQSIRSAFEAQKREEMAAKQNPFAVVNPAREPAPPELQALQIHRNDLVAIECIGSGQFGSVYTAKQKVKAGLGDGGSSERSRAVKLLKNGATAEDKELFKREAIVMLELRHPNIVRLIGVAIQQRPWLVVLEFMHYGDLRSVLKGCLEKHLTLHTGEMLFFGQQFAAGCAFIAAKRYVHMDLACRNVLLTTNNILKVADFGLARKFAPDSDCLVLTETVKLPLRWIAVEGFAEKRFSEKSDVWAFGVSLWEMFMYGALPYADMKTNEVPRSIYKGLRLAQPESCPDDVFQLVKSCWHADYNERPTFVQLRDVQSSLLEKYLPPSFRDIGLTLRKSKRGSIIPVGSSDSMQLRRSIPQMCPSCQMSLKTMPEFSAAVHLRVCETNQAEEAILRVDEQSGRPRSNPSTPPESPSRPPHSKQVAPRAGLPTILSESALPEPLGTAAPPQPQPATQIHEDPAPTAATSQPDDPPSARQELVLSEKAENLLRVRPSSQTIFQESKHSRIYEALNPQPLAFRTARERAASEEKKVEELDGPRAYSFLESRFEAMQAAAAGMADESAAGPQGGDESDEDEAEHEKPFDPKNLPEFDDEMKSYLAEMRRKRADASEARRRNMQEAHAVRLAAEQARLRKEIEEIKAREAEIARLKEVREDVVQECTKRVAQLEFSFRFG